MQKRFKTPIEQGSTMFIVFVPLFMHHPVYIIIYAQQEGGDKTNEPVYYVLHLQVRLISDNVIDSLQSTVRPVKPHRPIQLLNTYTEEMRKCRRYLVIVT